MRLRRLRGPLIGALVCSLVPLAGCGGPQTDGHVTSDPGKNPVLMDAMGAYMNKRSQKKRETKAKKPTRVAPGEAASGERPGIRMTWGDLLS